MGVQNQDGSGEGSGGSGQDSSSSGSQSSEGGSSSEGQKSKDYTKYSIQTPNILINTNSEIDWNYMKNVVEIIYTSWPTIMLDLHSINIKNEDILTFSGTLDTLIVAIQNEDKKATLSNLAVLYSFIPIYKEQYSDDNDKINIMYTKSAIVNSYALLEEERWDEMQAQIAKANEYFGLIINSINEDKNQSFVSKTYILVNEMNNAIKMKDKKLFYLKYKNLMESASNI